MPKKKSTNIVNIKELVNKKNDQIEEWLRERITEIYGDDDDVNNPILRLITIFDALSDASQKKLYNYAKKMAAEKQGEPSIKDEFWCVLKRVPSAWEDIEEFASALLTQHHFTTL